MGNVLKGKKTKIIYVRKGVSVLKKFPVCFPPETDFNCEIHQVVKIIILLANKHGCYNLETMELNLLNSHLRLQNLGHHCQINPNAFWVQRIIVNTIAVSAHLSHFFLAVSYQAPKSGNCWFWIKGNLLFPLSPHIFFKSLSLKQIYFLIQPFTHTLV